MTNLNPKKIFITLSKISAEKKNPNLHLIEWSYNIQNSSCKSQNSESESKIVELNQCLKMEQQLWIGRRMVNQQTLPEMAWGIVFGMDQTVLFTHRTLLTGCDWTLVLITNRITMMTFNWISVRCCLVPLNVIFRLLFSTHHVTRRFISCVKFSSVTFLKANALV